MPCGVTGTIGDGVLKFDVRSSFGVFILSHDAMTSTALFSFILRPILVPVGDAAELPRFRISSASN